jgi:hypothetical protein
MGPVSSTYCNIIHTAAATRLGIGPFENPNFFWNTFIHWKQANEKGSIINLRWHQSLSTRSPLECSLTTSNKSHPFRLLAVTQSDKQLTHVVHNFQLPHHKKKDKQIDDRYKLSADFSSLL